ncbi:MAG TPA: hypothetical protein VFE40_13185 [Jatrophihabitantaceae bacterium]|nr:hypothetical protein [Jatrophihabitantaceae bacterium]
MNRELEPDPDRLHGEQFNVDVGEFRQGSTLSQWALTRYLIGRAVGESLGIGLAVFGVLGLVAAVLLWWQHWLVPAAVIALGALCVLLMRAVLLALLRRLTALPGTSRRLREIVGETRGDVLRELRRLGLPGRSWTLPLLAWRLIRTRHRRTTFERLRGFDLARAVPPARLDELHLLLQRGTDDPPPRGQW